ncbi:MAG TPA: hypothetical protein PLF26_21250 [Blastocatellia bacterium]|nr:hypothetical protein [Blastocatellia bacterium]
MSRRRAKNLDDEAIKRIVEILDGWSGVLSWQALIEQVQARLQSKYTRQALHRHERIRLAFEKTKERLANPGKKQRDPAHLVRVPSGHRQHRPEHVAVHRFHRHPRRGASSMCRCCGPPRDPAMGRP